MLTARCSTSELEAALGPNAGVEIAATNAPHSSVISGPVPAVEAAAARLRSAGVTSIPMNVPYAFHGEPMDRIRAALVTGLRSLDEPPPPPAGAPRFYSTVTGGRLNGPLPGAGHWGRNLSGRVRFAEAIDGLLADGHEIFIEIGPHPVLTSAVLQCAEAAGKPASAIPTLHRGQDARTAILAALGRAYALGFDLTLSEVFTLPRRRVSLPAYPWQRRRHFAKTARTKAGDTR